jgi:pimeloyl-ACP methyl ester carboxylesterase
MRHNSLPPAKIHVETKNRQRFFRLYLKYYELNGWPGN